MKKKEKGGEGEEMTIKKGEGGPRRPGLVPNHPSSLSPCVQRQLRHKEKPLLELRLYFISYTSGGRQFFSQSSQFSRRVFLADGKRIGKSREVRILRIFFV